MLTVKEAAALLKCGTKFVHQLIREGKLKAPQAIGTPHADRRGRRTGLFESLPHGVNSPPPSAAQHFAEVFVVTHQATRNYKDEACTFHDFDDERLGIRKKENDANEQDENQQLPLSHWRTTTHLNFAPGKRPMDYASATATFGNYSQSLCPGRPTIW